MNLNDTKVERLRLLCDERRADEKEIFWHRDRDRRRRFVQQEMLALLDQYMKSKISTNTLKATFDRKTRSEWDVFGFKGMSGAGFLNTLVKHIPDKKELSRQLRLILPVPETSLDGQSRLTAFYAYVQAFIDSSQLARRQIQPVRTPFFVSAWWHLQDVENWPVFYHSGRRALVQEELFQDSGDPVADYFSFRDCFLSLAQALNLPSWELEHLLAWHSDNDKPPGKVVRPDVTKPSTEDGREIETTEEAAGHSQIQWLLAKMGRKLGCRIWIASNDHKRTWRGQSLGELSMKSLPPLGMDDETLRTVQLIAVIWIQGKKQIAAAFEVEHTTSIYSGLLRMSDLLALAPNLSFPLYIVAPESRLNKVHRELSRPTFQALNLHEQCGYFSFEALVREAEQIMRWAGGPSAIDKLATRVNTVSEE